MHKVTQEELTEEFLESLEAQNRRAKGLPPVKIKAKFLGEDDPIACFNGKIYDGIICDLGLLGITDEDCEGEGDYYGYPPEFFEILEIEE